jgi:hypothetical protein
MTQTAIAMLDVPSVNVTDVPDVCVPDVVSRGADRTGHLHRPTAERRAPSSMTNEQPVDAPAPSGAFVDIMATFGSVSFPMVCRPAVDEDEDCDVPQDENGS